MLTSKQICLERGPLSNGMDSSTSASHRQICFSHFLPLDGKFHRYDQCNFSKFLEFEMRLLFMFISQI